MLPVLTGIGNKIHFKERLDEACMVLSNLQVLIFLAMCILAIFATEQFMSASANNSFCQLPPMPSLELHFLSTLLYLFIKDTATCCSV